MPTLLAVLVLSHPPAVKRDQASISDQTHSLMAESCWIATQTWTWDELDCGRDGLLSEAVPGRSPFYRESFFCEEQGEQSVGASRVASD